MKIYQSPTTTLNGYYSIITLSWRASTLLFHSGCLRLFSQKKESDPTQITISVSRHPLGLLISSRLVAIENTREFPVLLGMG
ncbi:hypothetical protein Plhal703r1_c23g0097521 [Plasmopara halstedii]